MLLRDSSDLFQDTHRGIMKTFTRSAYLALHLTRQLESGAVVGSHSFGKDADEWETQICGGAGKFAFCANLPP